MEVRILPGTPLGISIKVTARVRKPAKRVGSNPTVWRFEFSRKHQIYLRRLAQRKSVGPTNRRSRYRNSQRLPDEAAKHPPVAQWQSNRPITGRPRIVTVREDQNRSVS